jgi:uncharacterized RDD family membrane protein YckC
MAAPPTTTRTHAGVPDRVAALLVDLVVLSVLAFLAAVVVSVVLGPAVDFDGGAESLGDAVDTDRGIVVADALLTAVLGAVYFIGSWARAGRTPGQRLLGLDVVDAAGQGRPSAGQAARRWLALIAPFSLAAVLGAASPALDGAALYAVVALWYLALLVTTATSRTRQGLHDRVAGTAVAKAALAWSSLREDPAGVR